MLSFNGSGSGPVARLGSAQYCAVPIGTQAVNFN